MSKARRLAGGIANRTVWLGGKGGGAVELLARRPAGAVKHGFGL